MRQADALQRRLANRVIIDATGELGKLGKSLCEHKSQYSSIINNSGFDSYPTNSKCQYGLHQRPSDWPRQGNPRVGLCRGPGARSLE